MLGDVGFSAVLGAAPYGGAGCCAWATAGPTIAATLSAATTAMVAERNVERGFISLILPSRYSATQQFSAVAHEGQSSKRCAIPLDEVLKGNAPSRAGGQRNLLGSKYTTFVPG